MNNTISISPDPSQRSARLQRTFKHGDDVWIAVDVNFGGLILEGVIVTPAGVAWPWWPGRSVTFSDPELKQRAEATLMQLLKREEESRKMPVEGGK